MSQKLIVIGLDGAPWTLLDPWISANKLPTFRKITHSGSKAILISTIPSITPPALSSMFTGMNPGNHGIFSFIRADGSLMTLTEIEYPKIWNVLDEHGFRSCVVNVRCTFPPERINGLMISGSVPSDKSNYVYPQDLRKRFEDFRNDKIEKAIFKLREKKRNEKYRKKFVDLLVERMRRRYYAFRRVNQEIDYDFSILWIEETDTLQHCCWEYKESLLRFYTEVDIILADIISNFPDRNLFVISDHGFESRPERFFYVNTWLRREGKLRQKPWPPIHHIVNFLQHSAYRYLRSRAELQILKLVERFRTSRRKRDIPEMKIAIDKIETFLGVDKKNSKAYLSTPFGISVNDPSDNDRVRDEIIAELRKVKDERGEDVIKGVWKREEIFMGKYITEIPDIIFLVSERFMPFPSLTRNLFGDIKRKVLWWQSGEHYRARKAILIAHGPTIRNNNDLGSVKMEDIAPTILHLLGCKIPSQVDGKVLEKIFKENSDPANRKPSFTEHVGAPEKEPKMERKDEEKIRARLKQLGYL